MTHVEMFGDLCSWLWTIWLILASCLTKCLFSRSDGIGEWDYVKASKMTPSYNFQDRSHHTIFKIDPILRVYCYKYYLRLMVHGHLDLWLFYTFWVFMCNYLRVQVCVIPKTSYSSLVVIVRPSVVHQHHTTSKFFVSYIFVHINLLCVVVHHCAHRLTLMMWFSTVWYMKYFN